MGLKNSAEEIKTLPKGAVAPTSVGVINRIITDLCAMDIALKGSGLAGYNLLKDI